MEQNDSQASTQQPLPKVNDLLAKMVVPPRRLPSEISLRQQVQKEGTQGTNTAKNKEERQAMNAGQIKRSEDQNRKREAQEGQRKRRQTGIKNKRHGHRAVSSKTVRKGAATLAMASIPIGTKTTIASKRRQFCAQRRRTWKLARRIYLRSDPVLRSFSRMVSTASTRQLEALCNLRSVPKKIHFYFHATT